MTYSDISTRAIKTIKREKDFYSDESRFVKKFKLAFDLPENLNINQKYLPV